MPVILNPQLGSAQRSNSAATGDGSTRKQFAEQVKLYSERLKSDHVHSGEHYKTFARFLEHAPPAHGWPFLSGQDSLFYPLYVHNNKTGDEKTKVVAYNSLDEIRSNTANALSSPEAQDSQLVILRGWQSREWLRTLGAHCRVDPEFFRRHIDFIEPNTFFDLPALPSACQNLWRLRITTICTRENPLSAEKLREHRRDELEGINKYLNAVRASERIGSSIVRRHAALSETTCIIEQDISFCVQKRKTGGWVGFIWLDHGMPFDDRSIAPWLDSPEGKATSHDPYIPVVQHLAKVVLEPPSIDAYEINSPQRISSFPAHESVHPSQSMNNLAAQYGITLDRNLMRSDALYTFSELFRLSLSAENQFINIVQSEVKMATRSFRGQEEACVDTLSYCKGLLDEHADRIKDIVALLDSDEITEWPSATDTKRASVHGVTRSIKKDYTHLLDRCTTLASRAIDGSSFIRNYAMLQASERSISQAAEVGRLTLLAYFFLPLSFVTSLFGMNFVEFSNWRNALISAICVFLGVTIVSLIVCFWDYMPWRRKEKISNSKIT